MRHPLGGKLIKFYLLAWVIFIIAHVLLYRWHYHQNWSIAITDALIFNCILAGFGFTLWWIVQYLSPAYQGKLNTIFGLLISVLLMASALSYLSDSILQQIFYNRPGYLQFSNSIFPWKIFLSILYMAVIVLIYHLLIYTNSLKEKEKDEATLQNLLKQSELEMLKFQINPHFIFNSLNSISSLTITAPDQAREMVIKLSDFLRSSLGNDNLETHSLKSEINQMNLYLEIEKVRFGDRLEIVNDVSDKCLTMTVPNMILQPLYENAIKFGVYEQLEKVTIHTKTKCDEGNLHIVISNNYDSNSKTRKGKGIGLKNVRNRLELIYGISDLVTIEKDKNQFSVRILIPQEKLR